MKTSKNNCKFFATLCTGLLLTACTSEELLNDTATEGTGRVMYATAAYNENNSPKTRMSYEDDLINNYMKLAWSAGDAFSAFISTDNTNTKHEFAIVAPEAGKEYTASEKFMCSSFPNEIAIADKTVIDAIYPSVSSETSINPKNVTLPLAAQTQAKHKSTDHLKQYDYMVGHAIYNSATPDKLNFSFTDHGDGNAGRLASIYRVTLTFPANVGNVNSIKLTATDDKDDASLTDAMALNFANGAISTVPRSHDGVTLTVTDGTTDTSDGKNQFIAYVMLYPSLIKTLTTEVKTDVGIFTKTETYGSEIVSTRGEFKLIPVDMSYVTPVIPNYTKYNEDGEGTTESPYLIWNEAQLRDLASTNSLTAIDNNTYLQLVSNITLTATEWIPIGNPRLNEQFKGHFDGNGRTVKGITITGGIRFTGLFGYTAPGSSIKNLSVEGNITNTTETDEDRRVGLLVGYNNGGTITKCNAKGTVAGTAKDSSTQALEVGGLVGRNGGDGGDGTGTITECSSTATVTGTNINTNTSVGGLVGNNYDGTITACYATGTITANGTNANVGGLVGNNNSNIFACYATGTVKAVGANVKVGGLVGNSASYIFACYATGEVTAHNENGNVGSLVGYTGSYINYCLTTGSIGKTDANVVDNIMGNVNGAITGVGAKSASGSEIKSCHGGDDIKNTINAEGETNGTGTGFGKMNYGIKTEIIGWLGVACPYHWVAGSSTPVIAPGAPL